MLAVSRQKILKKPGKSEADNNCRAPKLLLLWYASGNADLKDVERRVCADYLHWSARPNLRQVAHLWGSVVGRCIEAQPFTHGTIRPQRTRVLMPLGFAARPTHDTSKTGRKTRCVLFLMSTRSDVFAYRYNVVIAYQLNPISCKLNADGQ